MLLTCFKLFYIKDNSLENSVDFTKYKHNEGGKEETFLVKFDRKK